MCVYTCRHTHVVFDISVHPDLIPLVTKLQLKISEMSEADGLEESPCSAPVVLLNEGKQLRRPSISFSPAN